jgi:hypothetical protein
MPTADRRVFMLKLIAGTSAALSAHTAARAQAAGGASAPVQISNEPVKETDAYPRSMGFRLNTATVDKTKFPRHDVSQKCSNCQLYSGKPGEPMGGCSFFKRMVPPDGWCRNFKERKAA